mgnify:CR=1 FL=1
MDYVFTFLEGIASFISPCILPMLPIYISYFLGKEENSAKNAVINSCGFVLGLTIVFLTLSIFASQFGTIISENMRYIKIVFGILIIVLGLNYMEVFNLKILNKTKGINTKFKSFWNVIFSYMDTMYRDIFKFSIIAYCKPTRYGKRNNSNAIIFYRFGNSFCFISNIYGKTKGDI